MVPRRLPQSRPAAGPPARGGLVPGPGIGRRLAGGRPGSRTAGAPAGGLPVCGPPLVTVRSRARNEARFAATARADGLGQRPPGGDGAGAGPAVGGRAGRGAYPVRGARGGCLTRAEVSADHLRHLPASPGVVGSPAMAAGTAALRGAVPDGRFQPGSGPASGFRFGPVTASAPGRRRPAGLGRPGRVPAGARGLAGAGVTRGIVPSASGLLPVAPGALTGASRPPASAALVAGGPGLAVPHRVARRPGPAGPG